MGEERQIERNEQVAQSSWYETLAGFACCGGDGMFREPFAAGGRARSPRHCRSIRVRSALTGLERSIRHSGSRRLSLTSTRMLRRTGSWSSAADSGLWRLLRMNRGWDVRFLARSFACG